MDRRPAVVSQNSNTVSILSSNFGGPFTLVRRIPLEVSLGDRSGRFPGSGLLDLAISNSAIIQSRSCRQWRRNVSAGKHHHASWCISDSTGAADFNGDGKMDLAVLNTCGAGAGGCFRKPRPRSRTVTILLGKGDGTFAVSPHANNRKRPVRDAAWTSMAMVSSIWWSRIRTATT